MKAVRSILAVVLAGMVLAACGSDGDGDAAPAEKKLWTAYNGRIKKYAPESNAVAKSVIDRLVAADIACRDYADYAFDRIVTAYRLQDMPLALGAGNCFVGDENVLVEVFGKRPNAADFVAAKSRVICKRAKEAGRLPDGTSDFDGIPYVMAADKTWVVEPDTFEMNKRIAEALDRPSQDMCEGIK